MQPPAPETLSAPSAASAETPPNSRIAGPLLATLVEWRKVVDELRRLARTQLNEIESIQPADLSAIVERKDALYRAAAAHSGRVVVLESEMARLGFNRGVAQPAAFESTRNALLEAMAELDALEAESRAALQARMDALRSDLEASRRQSSLMAAYAPQESVPSRFFDQRR